MSDSFAPSRQRPAPAPDRLSSAIASGPEEPISREITRREAITESRAMLDEAERGDLAPWQLGRAIDLARQFPASETLQIAVGRLTRILAGAQAAASCWRDLLGRFPASTRILAEYAGVLRQLHGAEEARRIVDRYVGDPAEIEDPAAGLRAARAFHRLGDREAGMALLARFERCPISATLWRCCRHICGRAPNG
ncbi:MAG: hypothetical protein LC634_06725 [Sphingomonadales bacterium]|nr:hypothetical protein [Sphingomonadales bacterium]